MTTKFCFGSIASCLAPISLLLALSASQVVRAQTTELKSSQTAPAATISPVDLPKAQLQNKPIQDLPNFHQVHPFLYRGGEPTLEGLQQLKDKGTKSIIDLRAQTPMSLKEKARAAELGLTYVQLPMSDQAPTKSQVETFISMTRQARDKNEPLYLHCAHGSDRTGCLVGIWRVTEDGYNYDQAYKEMRKYWFGTKFINLSGAVKERAH